LLGRPGRTVTVRVTHLDAHLAGPILARLEVWVIDPASVDHETITIEEPPLVDSAATVGMGATHVDDDTKPVVLLVDDVTDHLRLYKLTLGDRYTVLCASTGRAGYELACSRRPNIVILDIMLPDIDGWDVCRRLRENAHTASMPIVLMTASADSDIAERALGSGAVALLRKPYVADHLVRTIDASLGGTPAS
ncbi:MAG TPA: response regulator, partial [Vicinamibacterales bacterium]|nr:response regulator [Vicinamibacterales bacterium]